MSPPAGRTPFGGRGAELLEPAAVYGCPHGGTGGGTGSGVPPRCLTHSFVDVPRWPGTGSGPSAKIIYVAKRFPGAP